MQHWDGRQPMVIRENATTYVVIESKMESVLGKEWCATQSRFGAGARS